MSLFRSELPTALSTLPARLARPFDSITPEPASRPSVFVAMELDLGRSSTALPAPPRVPNLRLLPANDLFPSSTRAPTIRMATSQRRRLLIALRPSNPPTAPPPGFSRAA